MSLRFNALFSMAVFITMLAALYAVFVYVPSEREMGVTQRIFYFHVPAAMSTYLAFFIVFVASIQFLRTQGAQWDRLALCAAELGIVFGLIVLTTGPIWARPIWGTWWRWEPRLASMLIMFTVYVAYLLMRVYGAGTPQIPRYAAILGIVAFINIPFVHYSVNLWTPEQQLHPTSNTLLDPRMVYTKYLCYSAVFLFFFYLLSRRLGLEKIRQRFNELQDRLDQPPDSQMKGSILG